VIELPDLEPEPEPEPEDLAGIGSDAGNPDEIWVPEPEYIPPGESVSLRGEYEEPPPPKSDKAKAGPPRLDEWQDFFSRVLIRSATNWYIDWAFRGIDEDQLSDREVERIKITAEERDRVAKPLSELANKLSFTRKHGRTIIAAAGASDSIIALGMWARRVNVIARKYNRRTVNVSPGQSEQAPVNGQVHVPGQQQYYSPGG
jgi:hypothetical protein